MWSYCSFVEHGWGEEAVLRCKTTLALAGFLTAVYLSVVLLLLIMVLLQSLFLLASTWTNTGTTL